MHDAAIRAFEEPRRNCSYPFRKPLPEGAVRAIRGATQFDGALGGAFLRNSVEGWTG